MPPASDASTLKQQKQGNMCDHLGYGHTTTADRRQGLLPPPPPPLYDLIRARAAVAVQQYRAKETVVADVTGMTDPGRREARVQT